ncbi:MAG: ribonuclease J [Parasporobacterium sp.]|nr:ribonuclease J [Parasporobacterium sp.]
MAQKKTIKPSGIKSGKSAKVIKKEKLKVIPLGGLECIGLNMTAIEYGDSIIVVDCGMAFADDTLLGIDLIIPDVSYLKQNRSKVKAFYITHGHEDHIGALPYILKDVNAPVYGTKLSVALILKKLEEHSMENTVKLKTVGYGEKLKAGQFNVEFIRTNHSISDAAALAISCPAGVILHTGDFKVDYTPVYGDAIDLWRLAELGKKGVLAVLCDSTNALRPGYTMSEKTVGETFDALFAEHSRNRIIIATFASNVDRVQQAINSACKYKRKVVLEGRSMLNVIETAQELGYIKVPANTIISVDEMKNYPDNKLTVITTGSQGEPMAALSRMAYKNHKKIDIKPDDVIIFSSSPIPGNEKNVSNVMNELAQMGAKVVFQQTHVSGHACQEEIKLIYSLLRPKYIIPVHGEFRHRSANRMIALDMGYRSRDVLMAETGDVIELTEKGIKVTGKVQAGGIYVDNSGVADVGRTVLQDRKDLAERGVLIVSVCIDKDNNFIVSGPEVFTRGWVYDGELDIILEEIKRIIYNNLIDYLDNNRYNRGKAKMVIGDAVRRYTRVQGRKGPMVLPFILEE